MSEDAVVVDLATKRKEREASDIMPITSTPAWRSACRHDGITVDEAGGIVECKHCGERLEPLAALLVVARNGNQWAGAIENARGELRAMAAKQAELQREVRRLTARRNKLLKEQVGDTVVFSVDVDEDGFAVQATYKHQSTSVQVRPTLEGVVDAMRVALSAWNKRRA